MCGMERLKQNMYGVTDFARSNIGPYSVVRLLGKGGMSEVYEVEDAHLGTHHALKLFTAPDIGDEVRVRFESEGRLLARLNHPRVVKVTDIGTEEGSGRPYFVMDLVLDPEGVPRSLADVEPGSVDEETVGRWYDDLREALAYIHGLGIVHRDLKLQNVLIGPDGRAVLTDFGVSKIGANAAGATVVDVVKTLVRERNGRSLVMGSVGYMAPELEMGVEASPHSDYYALGVILYRLLTGLWCDARTDVVGTLDTYDSVWTQILPKLLHSNPLGRMCVPYAETKRAVAEKAAYEAEERWLKAKSRGHVARHVARFLALGLVLAGGAWALSAYRCAQDAKALKTRLDGLQRQLALPTFSDVMRVPSGDGVSLNPMVDRPLATQADAWVLTHGIFDDLKSGAITLDKAADSMADLERRAQRGAFGLFDINQGYSPMGNVVLLQKMLRNAAQALRQRTVTAGDR